MGSAGGGGGGWNDYTEAAPRAPEAEAARAKARPGAAGRAGAPPFWAELADVASTSLGGRVLFASDDWFACADMLIAPTAPVFSPSRFTTWGKWMDGWESRRKRGAGHDWCIVALGAPARVLGFEVDTAFFTGNQAPRLSVQGAFLPGRGAEDDRLVESREAARAMVVMPDGSAAQGGFCAGEAQLVAAEELGSTEWAELLPRVPLNPGYEDIRHHVYDARPADLPAVTHLRVNIYPDGGVSRLRVRGEIVRKPTEFCREFLMEGGVRLPDLAAAENGGVVLGASNAHYGRASNIIAPGKSLRMDEGWETARNPQRPAVLSLTPEGLLDLPVEMADWVVVRLACPGEVAAVRIETTHFKGNCPEAFTLEYGAFSTVSVARADELEHVLRGDWAPLLSRKERLTPHSEAEFTAARGELAAGARATHLRLRIFPDGGVARLRVFGNWVPLILPSVSGPSPGDLSA